LIKLIYYLCYDKNTTESDRETSNIKTFKFYVDILLIKSSESACVEAVLNHAIPMETKIYNAFICENYQMNILTNLLNVII